MVTTKTPQFVTKKLKVHITICVEEDGPMYHGYCPSFKGLHVDGRTIDETCKNAAEAAVAYIISLIKHNEEIPCCEVHEPPASRLRKKIRHIGQSIQIPLKAAMI